MAEVEMLSSDVESDLQILATQLKGKKLRWLIQEKAMVHCVQIMKIFGYWKQ